MLCTFNDIYIFFLLLSVKTILINKLDYFDFDNDLLTMLMLLDNLTIAALI